jgi:hypothetical protein
METIYLCPCFYVNDFADSAIMLKLRVRRFLAEQGSYWRIAKRLKVAFDKEGIEIFPQMVTATEVATPTAQKATVKASSKQPNY